MAANTTSADVIAINTSESIVGIIQEFSKKIPELDFFAASPVAKTYFKTMVRTGLPTAGFRAVGDGRTRDVGTLTQRIVQCYFLDASWAEDEAFFTGTDWSNLEGEMQSAHLLAAFKNWQLQIYNGTANDAAGFPGLASLFPNTDTVGVTDAGGTTPTTGSSVYYIKTGTQDCCVCWGNNGAIVAGDIFPCVIDRLDTTLKQLPGRAQTVAGWAGLQLVNHKSVRRLANLTEDVGHTLTDTLLDTARTAFAEAYGVMPDGCLMSYRSLAQLQQSRTAFSPTASPSPVPNVDSANIQIIPTLGIGKTETLLAHS
jgi:hypothetical protein